MNFYETEIKHKKPSQPAAYIGDACIGNLTSGVTLSLVPLYAAAAHGSGEYWYDPYVVYTYEELWNAMDIRGNATGKKFIMLGADIDTSDYNSGFGLAAENAIKMETYQLTLDLNGKTLTIASQAQAFHFAINARGNLTIGDSKSGGKILHKHSLNGPHGVIDMVGYYTLTLNDGVTLQTEAPVHSMTVNATVWVRGGAYAIVNNANLLFEIDQELMAGASHNVNRPSGILVSDDSRLAIYNGEFTRVSVSKPFTEGGDTTPQVLINGGLFLHAMEIYAGDTLDKNGPHTLPIRINGGEFRQADEDVLEVNRSREQPFHIVIDHAGYGKATFLNFDNEPGSTAWEEEVREIMHEVYRGLFPENAFFLLDDSIPVSNLPAGSGKSLLDYMWLNTFYDYRVKAWICYTDYDGELKLLYPDSIKVYGNQLDIKAEYGGEDALAGTPDNPFLTDLSRSRELKVTWNEVTDELKRKNLSTMLYYMPDLSETEQFINGTSNGDGTRSATVTLPQRAVGQSYSPMFLVVLVVNNDPELTQAHSSKTLWLKSHTTETISTLSFKLDGALNAGDVKGPAISGATTATEKAEIVKQSPWTYLIIDENDDLVPVRIAPEHPVPISTICSSTLTLKAKPGCEFKTGSGTSARLQVGSSAQYFNMNVSNGGKTATVDFSVRSTAEYNTISLTVPNIAKGQTIPRSTSDILGLPDGIDYCSISWTYKDNPASSGTYTPSSNASFSQGYYYQCEVYIVMKSGVTVPRTVDATINEKPAVFSDDYSEGFSLTSDWFYIPDPRIAIEEVTLFADDELTQYTADTELLTAVAASGQYKKIAGKWYDGKNEVTSGKLAPGKTYTYKLTYRPESNYRFETIGFTARLYGGSTLPASYVDVRNDSLVISYPFTIPGEAYAAAVTADGRYTVAFVGFDGSGTLSYLKTSVQDFTVGENVIEIPSDVDISSVNKIFVWDNLISMHPACKPLDIQ